MLITPYLNRRRQLQENLAAGVLVLPTAVELIRNGDAHFPFRPDSHFYYLTGFAEPEAVLVMVLGDQPSSILFCRSKDEEREIWDGYRHGPAGAQQTFGFDAAYPIEELESRLPDLLANQPRVYFPLGQDATWDKRLTDTLAVVRQRARAGVKAPDTVVDIRTTLSEMRLFKDGHEVEVMRRAGLISGEAHRRAMQFTCPGQYEYAVEAELLHTFYRHGSRFPAYTSIVAGGANACVLHYIENNQILCDGDLLLIDAGCELEGYASDITRTFPVSGRFTAAQKDVYEVVLAAQMAALNAVQPGASWMAPHEAVLKVLAQGLIDLKLCEGSVDGVIESEAYRQFFMHRTGHWLGMDVHDVGDYKVNGDWRALAPGMVLTIEPGLYIRPAANVPEHLENIGIRIEDDVLVTADGHENLTASTPKTVAEIEAVMAEARG